MAEQKKIGVERETCVNWVLEEKKKDASQRFAVVGDEDCGYVAIKLIGYGKFMKLMKAMEKAEDGDLICMQTVQVFPQFDYEALSQDTAILPGYFARIGKGIVKAHGYQNGDPNVDFF